VPVRFGRTAHREPHAVTSRGGRTAGPLNPGHGIQALHATLAADDARNGLIADDVVHALGEGRSPVQPSGRATPGDPVRLGGP
jgi:hypothetical protein